jgi:predicted heme/steroid binding protein
MVLTLKPCLHLLHLSAAPKEYTAAELSKYDGSDPSLPIYVAIKGDVFDVSTKPDSYGKGAGYNCFAGKDASRVSLNEKNKRGEQGYSSCSFLHDSSQ